MKKRILILAVGLCMSLAVTGCGNNESAESSLESSLESTEETEVQRPTPSLAPGEDGCGTIKPPEMMQSTGGDGCVPTPPYMATEKDFDFGEAVNQETEEETESQESKHIIKAEGDEWVNECELSKLPETPYNKKLDEILEDRIEAGCGFLWNEENEDGEYYYKWIDCGMYYKVKDVDIVCFYDSEFGGMDYDIIGHFDELYIMKEGEYIFNGVVYTNFNDWLKNNFYLTPKFELTFDEKGYIVGCMDVAVS